MNRPPDKEEEEEEEEEILVTLVTVGNERGFNATVLACRRVADCIS